MLRKKIRVKVLEGSPFFISQEELIGEGSFGKVVRAYKKDEPSRELVAKIIPLEQSNRESIAAELKILKQIPTHPNLVNCLKIQISSENNFYLIMEYCNGGTFEKYINQNHNCSEQMVWRFMRDFCRGYRVLYDSHLIHRDIKPENILLHSGRFKIADFGLARRINHHSIEQNLSIKGTPLYLAPQLQNERHGCSKLDMFSLGVVVFRLAYNGCFPYFDQLSDFQTIQSYFSHLRGAKIKFPRYPKRSRELEIIVTKMLEKDPSDRLDWQKLFAMEKIRCEEPHCELEKVEEEPENFGFLRNSIVEIGKSATKLELISEPFNYQESLVSETQRILEFTQTFSNLEIKSLETFAMRQKILVELIRHLQKLLQSPIEVPKSASNLIRHIKSQFLLIIQESLVYCLHANQQLQVLIKAYSSEINEQKSYKMVQRLLSECEVLEKEKLRKKINRDHENLRLENLLYDFLTEYIDRPHALKESLKIPTFLMIDIYDGLLKLQSMAFINEQGRVEMVELELEDAELDRINYENLNTYQEYLNRVNEATVAQVEVGLRKMGLILQ